MNKEREEIEDNLGKKAPLLSGIPKENPFMVPEAYFDSLPALIMEKLREKGKHVPAAITDKIFWLFRPQWLVTVCVIVIGFCAILRTHTSRPSSFETIAASIPDSVIFQHIQNNIDYVDVGNLEEMVQNESIGSLPIQPVQDTAKKQIINYLMNANVDASEIENEL